VHAEQPEYNCVDILMRPRNITTYSAQSVLVGYQLSTTYIGFIRAIYEREPFVVPAEQIKIESMSQFPSNNGIDTTKQFVFNHVKEICLLFPRHVSDLTVHFNPCMTNLNLQMFNRIFPDQETNTTGARFLRSQLEAMGLDTILQCTESLERSYIQPPTWNYPVRDRSLEDNSDFVFVIPVERESANAFFFDGLDSNGNSENVTLTGKFVTDTQGNKINTYYNLNRHNNTVENDASYNRTPPTICLVSDTFWLFTSHNGGQVEYNTRDTWNKLFQERFPRLFDKLMAGYISRYDRGSGMEEFERI
jgi:hypothetical protein